MTDWFKLLQKILMPVAVYFEQKYALVIARCRVQYYKYFSSLSNIAIY